MKEFDYKYNSKYIADWDKTILDITIFDDDSDIAYYTTSFFGELSEAEISEQREYMYNMAMFEE